MDYPQNSAGDGKLSFRPVNYYCINVGELVRKSKTRTSWHFDLDDVRYCFEMEYTKIIGMKKLSKNGCLIYEEQPKIKQKPFQFEMSIGTHALCFS
mmetsp:Transcript_28999/g.43770  ORF Transcript_28999/g.43770 Transcript_28999/m.43770 type:complete len:96 (+) Transcript_28999:13-300(+)